MTKREAALQNLCRTSLASAGLTAGREPSLERHDAIFTLFVVVILAMANVGQRRECNLIGQPDSSLAAPHTHHRPLVSGRVWLMRGGAKMGRNVVGLKMLLPPVTSSAPIARPKSGQQHKHRNHLSFVSFARVRPYGIHIRSSARTRHTSISSQKPCGSVSVRLLCGPSRLQGSNRQIT